MARTDSRLRETYNALLMQCHELGLKGQFPSEAQIAQHYQVSRTLVRSALRRLAANGIIRWNGREKTILRLPEQEDTLPEASPAETQEELQARFFGWVLRADVPPGTQLNITALSRQFEVPPYVLQEFLAGLSQYSIVQRLSRGGWRLMAFTADYALELAELRALLEHNAVEHLLKLPDDDPAWDGLDALEAAHVDLQAEFEERYNEFSQLDQSLHAFISSAAANRFTKELQKVIALIFFYHYQWDKLSERDRNWIAIEEHLELIRALRRRDVQGAHDAMATHLATAKRTLLGSLQVD